MPRPKDALHGLPAWAGKLASKQKNVFRDKPRVTTRTRIEDNHERRRLARELADY